MSPKARRIVQVAYIAFVLIGVAVYKTFTGEIQAQLLAPGGIDGSVNWTQHVTIALILATALSIAIFFSIPASPLFYIAFGYFHGPFAGTLIAAAVIGGYRWLEHRLFEIVGGWVTTVPIAAARA